MKRSTATIKHADESAETVGAPNLEYAFVCSLTGTGLGYTTLLFLLAGCFLWLSMAGRAAIAQAAGAGGATTEGTPAAGAAGANAAVEYRRALGMLPQSPDAPDFKALLEGRRIPLDDHAALLIRKYESAVRAMHSGAAIRECDWGIDLQPMGPLTPLPHLYLVHPMCELMVLRIRQETQRGDAAAALDDVATLLAFGRHVATTPQVFCRIVGNAVEVTAMQFAGGGLAEASPNLLRGFAARLDALPPDPPSGDVLAAETDALLQWLAGLEANDPKLLFGPDGPMTRLIQPRVGGSADRLRVIRREWSDPTSRGAAIDEVKAIGVRSSAEMSAPRDQFDRDLEGWKAQTRAGTALAASLAPSLESLRYSTDDAAAMSALLWAAIAIRLSSPKTARATRDPFGSGPFEYKPAAGGFTLASRLTMRGETVSITVTRASTEAEAGAPK